MPRYQLRAVKCQRKAEMFGQHSAAFMPAQTLLARRRHGSYIIASTRPPACAAEVATPIRHTAVGPSASFGAHAANAAAHALASYHSSTRCRREHAESSDFHYQRHFRWAHFDAPPLPSRQQGVYRFLRIPRRRQSRHAFQFSFAAAADTRGGYYFYRMHAIAGALRGEGTRASKSWRRVDISPPLTGGTPDKKPIARSRRSVTQASARRSSISLATICSLRCQPSTNVELLLVAP